MQTSEELKKEIVTKAVERAMNEHQVPARQLLAAIKNLESVMGDHALAVSELKRISANHDTGEARAQEMMDGYEMLTLEFQSLLASLQTELERVSSIKPEPGKDGVSPKLEDIVLALKPHLPKPNEVDPQQIVAQVIELLPKTEEALVQEQEPLDVDALFDQFIARIQKERPIDVSHLKNAESFMFGKKKYKIEELMRGAGGTGGSSGTSVYGEVVAGSGTAWTLANAPTAGTLRLYANGQRLKEGAIPADYTLSGTNITTNNSWALGTLLADYSHT